MASLTAASHRSDVIFSADRDNAFGHERQAHSESDKAFEDGQESRHTHNSSHDVIFRPNTVYQAGNRRKQEFKCYLLDEK